MTVNTPYTPTVRSSNHWDHLALDTFEQALVPEICSTWLARLPETEAALTLFDCINNVGPLATLGACFKCSILNHNSLGCAAIESRFVAQVPASDAVATHPRAVSGRAGHRGAGAD
jgi:hypothetical protein